MQEAEPEVTKHIESLGITPLQLVLPWMLNAFANQLPVDQLLLLWDRIIALDSLLPLPLLALAVFVFRREVNRLPPQSSFIQRLALKVLVHGDKSSHICFEIERAHMCTHSVETCLSVAVSWLDGSSGTPSRTVYSACRQMSAPWGLLMSQLAWGNFFKCNAYLKLPPTGLLGASADARVSAIPSKSHSSPQRS